MFELFDNTILIVDDTPENIDILVDLLDNFDKKIAINGRDALEVVFEKPYPDLILLDVMMPEIDGFEVCRQLRLDERTKDIPVIFLTAKAQKEDVITGFEAGGQDYITKPFDYRELMERVKTQLELRYQRKELKELNSNLEEKVKQRTKQLMEANIKVENAYRELKGLDAARNNFLNLISHEIRTPLNGIAGAAHLLSDMVDEDNELFDFVDMLKESAVRLEKFSTAALLITQIQAENYKAVKAPVKIDDLIYRTIEANIENITKKGIQIDVDIQGKEEVNIEDGLFIKVLDGVLNNAVKYSKQQGPVKIISRDEAENQVFEIIDEGEGFSQDALQNLFKPFGIGEKHHDKNVGLSLIAARKIMEAHGGQIEVNQTTTVGAKVKLLLPK
jgi:two-component system sensor histidine kinase/response regulator